MWGADGGGSSIGKSRDHLCGEIKSGGMQTPGDFLNHRLEGKGGNLRAFA